MSSEARRRLLYRALAALAARRGQAGRYQPEPLSSTSNYSLVPATPLCRFEGSLSTPARRVLGLSAFYHDSAAALVVDGTIVAAAHEERFSRRRHDSRLPHQAIASCLAQAGLTLDAVDLVAFYEEPLLKVDRLLDSALAEGLSFDQLRELGWFGALERNLALAGGLGSALGFSGPVCFVQHHLSHAASAFLASPFSRAACLTLDGVGEWASTTLARGEGQDIEILKQIDYPHSLGLLYSTVTAHLGFAVNSDEYKVMALAAYGRPTKERELISLLTLFDDGSFALRSSPLRSALNETGDVDSELARLLGVPPRARDDEIRSEHEDLARSLQDLTERTIQTLLAHLHALTGLDCLVMAGGVALNGVANFRAFSASPFRRLFIQPAAGDAGGALGAALYAASHFGAAERTLEAETVFDPCLGPVNDRVEVRRWLTGAGIPHRVLSPENLVDFVAHQLARGRVAGWVQGRMEFGPRALGSRSILADPRDPGMKETLNRKVKFREGFRPFGPVLPEEDAQRYLNLEELQAPLYSMLFVVPVLESVRAEIPAAVHVDGTTRPQLVSASRAPLLHALLRAFERETGHPVLINTSFNLAGEPIVCTAPDAYRTFRYSGLDLLVLEDCVVEK